MAALMCLMSDPGCVTLVTALMVNLISNLFIVCVMSLVASISREERDGDRRSVGANIITNELTF